MNSERTVHHVTVEGRRLQLTNLDKIMYPATETTKGEVLNYYSQVAPRLLAQLRNRVVTRVRFPHGVTDLKFFEKNTPSGAPGWIERTKVGDVLYPQVRNLADLTYFVNLASVEFHSPQWLLPGSEGDVADRIVIDLDPGAPAGLDECAQVALVIKDLFDALNWTSVPVTSGSKGLQIYAQTGESMTSDQARETAHTIANKLHEGLPDLVIAQMTKSARAGKVFLDWSQNAGSKTTITPWSLRGRSAPYVALPRQWSEIEQTAREPGSLTQVDADEVLASRLNTEDPMCVLHQK